ncbi:MAG: bifunctional diguanylate cyclase/phosphodiesterase [Kangiellaceae bacterium]
MEGLGNGESELLEENQRLHSELASLRKSQDVRAAKLYESEEQFALALRSANDGLWDWNLETDEVYYSPRWKSMLGYREDEMDNSIASWAEIVHPEEKGAVIRDVQNYIVDNANTFEVEMRLLHKKGHYIDVRSRGLKVLDSNGAKPVRIIGTHVDITQLKKAKLFDKRHAKILEMIAKGESASKIYIEIALLYEEQHSGMRCSMLELEGNKLLHGGAPSLPKVYCEAVDGLQNGPEVGSCGASTYTGKRVIVENIETDPKWSKLKETALPHGMRCCWSEPIKNTNDEVLGAFGMYYDHPALPTKEELMHLESAARLAGIVMERDQNQKRIKYLAFNDELTGLSSRTHFHIRFEELIENSVRHDRKFALLYIDLDNFKYVNDSLGHDVGDLLLKEVAERLNQATRNIDYIARLSGDEFCIVVNELSNEYSAVNVAQRCLDLVSQPAELSGRRFIPACSIGIAQFPKDGETSQSLLKAADTALYSAKDLGRNRYAFYQKNLTEKAEYRFKIEQLLREAIEKRSMSLVYQPQLDINSGKIISVEALCRWHQPQLNQFSPTEFIEMAEEIGMIKPLTEWVLMTACEQVIKWKNEGSPSIRMAINVSPTHFLDVDFVPLVERVLESTGVIPGDIELEVTEGVAQNHQKNLDIIKRLKSLGILLAIDDFGTGYSSFASLKHLKVDCLKIDKYFMDDLLIDSKAKTLIASMIEMGQSLGYKITAEGIEQQEQFEMIRSLGCDRVQGFLFSKPVNAEEIPKLLQKYSSALV